jgi:hypothetical protein
MLRVSTHPRPPSSAACPHPPALLGSAELAASRPASPCSARRACRWRRTLPRQWGVGGKPGQHRSDRLGLLLVKAAAGLAAQQLHLDGEP